MMTAQASRLLVEHCPFGLSQHRASGEFLAASPACGRLLGIASDSLIGQDFLSLVSSSEQHPLRRVWAEALASHSEQQLRFLFTRPDGSSAWIELRLGPVAGESDGAAAGPLQLVCCCRDVTAEVAAESAAAQRLAEAELAERHRDYLVKLTPGLIWYGPVSPDLSSYRATFMSEYLFRVTGYSAEQWLRTKGFWASIIHPEDREWVLREAPAAMKEQRPLGPYRIRASDGRTMWIQSQMALERDAAGVPLRMYGLTLDMTAFQQANQDRQLLQQELGEQAARLLELSTPLIPVSDDMLVLPVIGTLDPARAQYALETLLNGVVAHRARYVLVDLTGVSIVDASAAQALLKMTAAVRLLGARVVMTGLRPEIARALTELALDLTDVITRPTLRAALAEFANQRPAAKPRRQLPI